MLFFSELVLKKLQDMSRDLAKTNSNERSARCTHLKFEKFAGARCLQTSISPYIAKVVPSF
jgi:hypothetical protein